MKNGPQQRHMYLWGLWIGYFSSNWSSKTAEFCSFFFQMFTLRPLTITLPSREDKNLPVIDLDLHLPFLCFRPQQLLLVLHANLAPKSNKGRFRLTITCLPVSISSGAFLPSTGAAGGVVFCWLGKTYDNSRKPVHFSAGPLT